MQATVAVKERPILMSAPMVRALLDGRKTQTRRKIACPPSTGAFVCADYGNGWWPYKSSDGESLLDNEGNESPMNCPYGKPGDRLWVRESFYQYGHWEAMPGVKTKTGRMKWKFVSDSAVVEFDPSNFVGVLRKGRHHKDPATSAWHKRLGRFMPKKASRITLEITEVRVQRLQEISEADVIAEGCELVKTNCDGECGVPDACRIKINRYVELWESINGAGSWDANPWVWAVSFKLVQP